MSSGLVTRSPRLAGVMLLSMLSLIGLPPMIGFLGKINLFVPALGQGSTALIVLVIIAVLNSAISATYYLRIAGTCFFGAPRGEVNASGTLGGRTSAVVAAVLAVILGLTGSWLVNQAARATADQAHRPTIAQADGDANASPLAIADQAKQ